MDYTSHATFTPLQNLKGFVINRPPLVVFLICLVTFAVTAASLAYVVRRSEMRDLEVTMDWNIVLDNFAKLEICVNHNGSSSKPIAAVARDVSAVRLDSFDPGISSTDLPTFEPVGLEDLKGEDGNYTISTSVDLKFGSEIHSLPSNITYVTGTICGKLLGLTGASAEREITVSFELPRERNFYNCDVTKGCEPPQKVCMTFYGLPKLPATRKLRSCSAESTAVSQANHSVFSVEQCPGDQLLTESEVEGSLCHGTVLHLVYETNPELTIMLTEHDRTLINLHLMYTSYFILVMVMTLLCYAIIRGRPKSKGVLLLEKVPFDS